MEGFERGSFTTARSLTYAYYSSTNPVDDDKPAVLLLHGFPDSAQLWSEIVTYLTDLPYRILVPDILGHGGTSKPTNASEYNSKSMADDMVELLDAEHIKNVIAVGHDWGSFLAQRVYLWHPDRVAGLILLNVAYMPPDQEHRFDLDTIMAMSEEMCGYPQLAYWELFTAPDGAETIGDHLESFWTVMHGDKEDWMKRMFCTRGAMREYLLADERVELKSYAKDRKWREPWMELVKRNGLAAPLNWYHAMKDNHQFEAEKELPKHRFRVNVPVLFLGSTRDAVSLTSAIKFPQEKGLLPDLEVKEIESGHWVTMEKPEEVGQAIVGFLKARF